MTASRAARRKSTWVGLIGGLVALGFIVALGAVGARTLADSQVGRDAASDHVDEVRQLPVTRTAMVGVIDDDGRLTSVVAMVLAPNGVGGSIVSIPATADASLGLGDDRVPINEVLELSGPEVLREEFEGLAGISFDVAELMEIDRLAEFLEPLGELVVEFDRPVLDDDRLAPVAEAGLNRLSAIDSANVLTAYSSDESDAFAEPARNAVWQAVADRVGAGIGSAEPVDDGQVPPPVDVDEFGDRLFAGSVGWRGIAFTEPAENSRGVDVVVPDRAELLLVFGQVAPARLGAPNPSITFRVESHFSADQTAVVGANSSDVAVDAINRLLFVQANVVSVETTVGDVPAITQIYPADLSIVGVLEENYPLVFGELEVLPAPYRIEGVDAIVVLGESYLEYIGDTIDVDLEDFGIDTDAEDE